MCLSIFYAQVMGLWLFIVGLAMVTNQARFKKTLTDSLMHPSFVLTSGLISLTLGLLVVISHNIWVSGWPVVVTIIGWILLLQALVRLFWPDSFVKSMKDIFAKNYAAWSWLWLIVGLYLIWAGFWA